jgi:MFS family permease/1-acyl-sn-glycerol-3-phosphate acyltransferase
LESIMAFQPADTLKNRTFVGLIVAQFLAGFNDQAIHASAMFYAIHKGILTEAQAISLMPILFYAPWAIFCTLAGYLADRFSKRHALVTWKLAEVGIALVALAGFWIGTVQNDPFGAWIVLSAVFLMGTHAAFFAPAKYGAMPEILQPHVLSRGNGILESTTFLAAILGTVSGGFLFSHFRDREQYIGVVLLVLALIGAVASFLIARLPAANPDRPFPANIFKPLFDNLRVMVRARPLVLSMLGIAFFIFMVSYMRAAVYMHGQTRNPRWEEDHTSLVVATVALGVGLGAPLAGFLSGGKVELGLVPLGTLGMAGALIVAAFTMHIDLALIVVLIFLGFCSGFYMVPLYTLLQHRAPKTSKGDLIATSNFINVTGAMAASLLFYLLVLGSEAAGLTPLVANQQDYASGTLTRLDYKKGRPVRIKIEIDADTGETLSFRAKSETKDDEEFEQAVIDEPFEEGLFELVGSGPEVGDPVIVSSYTLHGTEHYRIRPAAQPMRPVFDNERLPRYLFMGAAIMTLGILVLLCRRLPDFFIRSLFWLRCLGRYRIRVLGMHNLPSRGPVILACNCNRLDSALQVVAATDRYTHFLLRENTGEGESLPVLRFLARRNGFLLFPSGPVAAEAWTPALTSARMALDKEDLLAVTVAPADSAADMDRFVCDLRQQTQAPILPVYCGPLFPAEGDGHRSVRGRPVRVVFGAPLPADASFDEIQKTVLGLADSVWQSAGKVV